MNASKVETLQWNFTFYWREITQLLRNCLKLHRATGKYIIYLISVKKKKKRGFLELKISVWVFSRGEGVWRVRRICCSFCRSWCPLAPLYLPILLLAPSPQSKEIDVSLWQEFLPKKTFRVVCPFPSLAQRCTYSAIVCPCPQ